MKAENKHTFMIWAIVVLALMNISTLATILYHQHESKKLQNEVQNKMLETDVEKFSGRYFRDKLGLKSSQMDDFRSTNRAFRRQARYVIINLAEKRRAMMDEMAASKSDTARLNVLSDSIGILHSQLKKLTYHYYLNLKNICDSNQREKLEILFRDMFSNDAPMSFPGHGMMNGQKACRKFN